MTNKLIATVFILFLFVQCQQPHSKPVEKVSLDKPQDTTVLVGNFHDSIPDTLVFHAKDKTFRLLEDTVNFRYAIERMDNTVWHTLDSLDRPRMLRIEDWNKDGFVDILMEQRWHVDLRLYNPFTYTFEKPFDVGEPDGAFLLDTTAQVYYSMLTNKFEDEQSRLFIIDNYIPVLRGYMEGLVGSDEYSLREKPKGIYVYKFKNNTLAMDLLYSDSNLILVEKFTIKQYKAVGGSTPYLFYKQYWEKNAKKF